MNYQRIKIYLTVKLVDLLFWESWVISLNFVLCIILIAVFYFWWSMIGLCFSIFFEVESLFSILSFYFMKAQNFDNIYFIFWWFEIIWIFENSFWRFFLDLWSRSQLLSEKWPFLFLCVTCEIIYGPLGSHVRVPPLGIFSIRTRLDYKVDGNPVKKNKK